MEDQQAPVTTETRTAEQDLVRLFSDIAAAYQIDKEHQEAVDQRAHQIRLMTEQHRHTEATQWISAVADQRQQHYQLLRHQFDRQFLFTVGLAVAALAIITGLIFLKDDLKTASTIFIAILAYLAGRRSKDILSGLPPLPVQPEMKPPKQPQT